MLYNANVVRASTLDFVDLTVHSGQRIHIFLQTLMAHRRSLFISYMYIYIQ